MILPRKIVQVLGLLMLILVIGVLGYHWIEGWPLFDALYMTVITLATVGYGETHPLSHTGRVFTIFLILGGMGILLYGITEMTAFLVEGEMSGFLRRRKMDQKIQKLSGHYILCGAGQSGYYILEELLQTNRACVVIENDEAKMKALANKGALVVQGDATDDNVLKEAGIERAAGLVCALTQDKDNLFVVISARGLNPRLRIISRTENQESRSKFLRAGADSVVATKFIGGLRMVSELVRPNAVHFLDAMLRGGDRLRVEEVVVGPQSALAHKPVQNDLLNQAGVLLLSIKKGEEFHFNPGRDTTLHPGDTLVVIGNPDQLGKLQHALNA